MKNKNKLITSSVDITVINNIFFLKSVLGSPGLFLCGMNESEKEEPNAELMKEQLIKQEMS